MKTPRVIRTTFNKSFKIEYIKKYKDALAANEDMLAVDIPLYKNELLKILSSTKDTTKKYKIYQNKLDELPNIINEIWRYIEIIKIHISDQEAHDPSLYHENFINKIEPQNQIYYKAYGEDELQRHNNELYVLNHNRYIGAKITRYYKIEKDDMVEWIESPIQPGTDQGNVIEEVAHIIKKEEMGKLGYELIKEPNGTKTFPDNGLRKEKYFGYSEFKNRQINSDIMTGMNMTHAKMCKEDIEKHGIYNMDKKIVVDTFVLSSELNKNGQLIWKSTESFPSWRLVNISNASNGFGNVSAKTGSDLVMSSMNAFEEGNSFEEYSKKLIEADWSKCKSKCK